MQAPFVIKGTIACCRFSEPNQSSVKVKIIHIHQKILTMTCFSKNKKSTFRFVAKGYVFLNNMYCKVASSKPIQFLSFLGCYLPRRAINRDVLLLAILQYLIHKNACKDLENDHFGVVTKYVRVCNFTIG